MCPAQWQLSMNADTSTSVHDRALDFACLPVDKGKYLEAFQGVQEHIHNGNTYLLNLTFPSYITTSYGLYDIYLRAMAPFKLWVKDRFVVFSPERFVRIEGNQISTFPMKGTISADIPGNDRRLAEDVKENAEHNTIVDLLRNDLSIVATRVKVTRLKYLQRVKTHRGDIWQMSSEISGTVRPDYQQDLGGLLDRMLPAGSVSGAPKAKTLEIINELEGYDRGFYTGIFGHYDGTVFDSAVSIRFIEQIDGRLWYKSGGGITHLSQAEDEYDELKSKIYVPFV